MGSNEKDKAPRRDEEVVEASGSSGAAAAAAAGSSSSRSSRHAIDTVQLYVRFNGDSHGIVVSPQATVGEFLALVKQKTKRNRLIIDPSWKDGTFVYCGREWKDQNKTLDDHGVQKEATIDYRLHGDDMKRIRKEAAEEAAVTESEEEEEDSGPAPPYATGPWIQ